MGLGNRIFIIGDNDSMTRMPVKRFNRLVRRDPAERFPEYAGKRLRYALIVIESENRKSVEVLEYRWTPTEEIGAAIYTAIFGKP